MPSFAPHCNPWKGINMKSFTDEPVRSCLTYFLLHYHDQKQEKQVVENLFLVSSIFICLAFHGTEN
jgi:hypothetical protein